MKYLSAILFIVGLFVWLGLNALAATWTAAPPESPPAPLPEFASQTYGSFDVQIHSRDSFTQWDAPFAAQHGPDCSAPPSTHVISALNESVFVCNGHWMTAGNAAGYGEIVLTPSQLLDCTFSCTVQWDMSTERMSTRDWPDVWLTPWADNLALPFDIGDVDLQGIPRQGIHVTAAANQNSWGVNTISNYVENGSPGAWWVGMGDGIDASVNQAAVRQTFKLTVTTGHLRFERLPSATATGFVWVDANAPVLMAPDYVVQFGHHSYNPTKPDPNTGIAGVPATWHWSGFALNPAVPFSLIHTTPALVTWPSPVMFNSPAPAGAYLRFSAVCRVLIDGVLSTRQTFLGHPEHASDYFIPVAQGKTGVNVTFLADDWYSGPCALQDAAVWAKGGPPSIPTPSPSPLPPTATSTSTPVPSTPTPSATSTSTPMPTATPVSPTATRIPSSPTATPKPAVTCNQAYFKNHVLTEGAAIPCP